MSMDKLKSNLIYFNSKLEFECCQHHPLIILPFTVNFAPNYSTPISWQWRNYYVYTPADCDLALGATERADGVFSQYKSDTVFYSTLFGRRHLMIFPAGPKNKMYTRKST